MKRKNVNNSNRAIRPGKIPKCRNDFVPYDLFAKSDCIGVRPMGIVNEKFWVEGPIPGISWVFLGKTQQNPWELGFRDLTGVPA